MPASPVQKISFSGLLERIRNPDTKDTDQCHSIDPFRSILPVVLSYVHKNTLSRLMQVSLVVLREVLQSNIRIPLSLYINSDFADRLLEAKTKLETLKRKTKLSFSLKLRIHSNGVEWVHDIDLLNGLDRCIKEGVFVHSIAIQNLHVDLEGINKSMGQCISSMRYLEELDLSGYHCDDVEIFERNLVPELTTLCTLGQVKVNRCSLLALRTLCMTNTSLYALKLYATGGNVDRTRIFSTLSALRLGTLRTFSMHNLDVVTRGESEKLEEFVHSQPLLSRLSLSLCEVTACNPVVGLLKHTRLETLKLHRLHIGQPELRRVLEQIGNMTQLQSLTLTHNHCIDTDAAKLCSSLRDMTRLRRLKLSYLSLGAESVPALAAAFTSLQGLQQVDLSNNRFQDIDVSSFVAALSALSKLTRLRLENCRMTPNVHRQMQTVLQKQI